MPHPLSGASLPLLRRMLREAGDVPLAKKAPLLGAAAGRAPFSALEKGMEGRLRSASEMKPPVFLLGHWRSGTTHLYNIMSLGEFGYVPPVATGMPGEMLTLGKWLKPFLDKQLPDSRYIDNIPVTPTSPQEDEIALANLSPLSFYHGIYFPSRFDEWVDRGLFFEGASEEDIAGWEEAFVLFMRKLDRLFEGKQLLIKNPVYTARPAQLLKLFPGAKLVHLHRNPVDVFLSMKNFYEKLLPVMALQPYDHVDIEGTVLRVYDEMMRRLTEETKELKAPQFTEIAYADLNANPIGTVLRLYDELELGGFEEARPRFEAYLGSIEGYQKNRFEKPKTVGTKVAEAWAPWFERWGYEKPAG
ncbi:sulfotransferase family protein [Parvularcula maris]|uniref:Sulfotransferase n=1 Tax=Parvularcula maris TaxID=2965077 RepID=A0A9X2L651_9PROT|nr:sulfotransferase [Parvularcula maris]MCQ8183788.1 sulfotransferase [Parvularcula maris]